MDSADFDQLARSLVTRASRRRVLAGALSAALGPIGWRLTEDAAAHDARKHCKKLDNKARKKGCLKRARKHNARHGRETPPPPDECPDGTKACDGTCIPSNQCCTDADCPLGGESVCCRGVCDDTVQGAGTACHFDSACCSNYCRQDTTPSDNTCAATCRGRRCTADAPCCPEFDCLNIDIDGVGFCGGCKDQGRACETDADCCFSDCEVIAGSAPEVKTCGSYTGGPCSRNVDCQRCYEGGECRMTINGTPRDICQNGVCGCPTDCCFDADCPSGSTCQSGTCSE